MSEALGKEGFLGECGDTKGKFRGAVTPQSRMRCLQQGPVGLGASPLKVYGGTGMRSEAALGSVLEGMTSLCCGGMRAGTVEGGRL